MKTVIFFWAFLLTNTFVGHHRGINDLQDPKVETLNYDQLKPLLYQGGDQVYVVNFWATWCAPCIKELPYFEQLNSRPDVEVLLVSLDFPKHKESRLLPFLKKHQLQSQVVHLDDTRENYWINAISKDWSGALPATIIYTQERREFYEGEFSEVELIKTVESFLNP